MFKTRLISGIILVVLTIFSIYVGGYLLGGVLVCISTIGLIEYEKVCGIYNTPLSFMANLYVILLYFFEFNYGTTYILPVIVIALMAFMVIYVFFYPRFVLNDIAKVVFGCVYIPTMLSFIMLTRNLTLGLYIVWLIFLCSWGCDTCAYCVGVLIGKHKMSPILSPKKSIEGAIGGVVGSVLLTLLFLNIFKEQMGLSPIRIYSLSGLSAIGAFMSMIGDLVASAIKRNYDIKDYGKLIPGHGGIMDRFDSVIVTAPIIYFLGLYLA